ncbi:MAG: GNAT family N-acetyltransferase [Myxococcales bacterium]
MRLRNVEANDGELLANLLELYIHDLSPFFPQVRIGENGRFGYPRLPSYLDGGSDRFARIIEVDGRPAGFVLAQRGSPVSEDPAVLDIAEFFVLRSCRGQGVGRRAAHALWEQRPGTWTIRVSPRNPAALGFWETAVASFLKRPVAPRQHSVSGQPWSVFWLES